MAPLVRRHAFLRCYVERGRTRRAVITLALRRAGPGRLRRDPGRRDSSRSRRRGHREQNFFPCGSPHLLRHVNKFGREYLDRRGYARACKSP